MIVWEGVADPGDGFDGHGLFCSGRRKAHTCDCGAPGWPVPGMSHAALADPEDGTGWDNSDALGFNMWEGMPRERMRIVDSLEENFSDPAAAALIMAQIEGFIAGMKFRIGEITRVPELDRFPPQTETFEYTFRLAPLQAHPCLMIFMPGDDT